MIYSTDRLLEKNKIKKTKKLYINDRGIFLAILMCKQTFPWRLCNTFFIILILARLYSAEEDDEEEI